MISIVKVRKHDGVRSRVARTFISLDSLALKSMALIPARKAARRVASEWKAVERAFSSTEGSSGLFSAAATLAASIAAAEGGSMIGCGRRDSLEPSLERINLA